MVHASVQDTLTKAYRWTDSNGVVSLDGFLKDAIFSIRALGYELIVISRSELKERNYQVTLQPDDTQLDQVIVSATKWRQPKDKSPLKVVRINAEDVSLPIRKPLQIYWELRGCFCSKKPTRRGQSHDSWVHN